MKKIILFFVLVSMISLRLGATSWLNVQDPQSWNVYGQGSIDEAVLTIEPKGIYFEYNLYLTFSANGMQVPYADSLEVTFDFSLPENTIIHDSWLWIEDEPVQADIMDRWKAYMIYENIVKRRRDPSILYKNWRDNYTLKIYPMDGDGTRKIKLSCLVPSNFTDKTVSADLLTELINSSRLPLNTYQVLVKETEEWKSPEIPGQRTINFIDYNDASFGKCKKAVIGKAYLGMNLCVSFPSPIRDGFYLRHYNAGNMEGYYQMVFLPEQAFNIECSKKVLFLFDFETDKSYNTNGNSVYQSLRSVIMNSLGKGDYFNIIFSSNPLRKASQAWIPADDENMERVFSSLGDLPVKDYSDLKRLLITGIEFIKNKNGEGEIILLGNSDHFCDIAAANELMEDLKEYNTLPPIHIADFYNLWDTWNCFGGNCYTGNEYLYNMITRYTSGSYLKFNYWELSQSQIILELMQSVGQYLTSFDMHNTMMYGFCHSRYELNKKDMLNISAPIVQIGKFQGVFPMTVEATTVYGDRMRSFKKVINGQKSEPGDSLMEEMWTGNYIESLVDDWTWDNKTVDRIIEVSVNERVLSRFTAFLCLEPGMEPVVDPTDPSQTGGNALATSESGDMVARDNMMYTGLRDKNGSVEDKVRLTVMPNPFIDEIRIEIAIPQESDWRQTKIEIYDLGSKVIRSFSADDYSYNGALNLTWDGKTNGNNEALSGMYIIVISGNGFKKSLKVYKAQKE